ncbi:transcriptional regulator, LuxR family domain protein [Mycobacterium xenopi 4042]|uniref:Transcriptional regulator, LuxR family domain protein n=1 Tax=Mycobacterium xenopi 4042 TaxID=1299334 RepID=X8BG45_MYCXE|nr:transcriptional regulator, LuxR family domain protein [Mycobacterium xenopi 4042]
MLGRRLRRMTPRVARVVDTLSQCEPLSVEVLCDLVRRRDLESAEQMRLVTVERVGDERVARLAHPLFGELRQATAGELHLSKVRGQLARRLAREVDRDMRATVRRALLTLHSDLDPDPKLYLEAARFSMMLLDPDSAERFAAAAAACGAPDAAPMRAMTLVLLGRGEQAEEALRAICGADREDRHRWSTIRAANLIWMLGRPGRQRPFSTVSPRQRNPPRSVMPVSRSKPASTRYLPAAPTRKRRPKQRFVRRCSRIFTR